MNSPSLRAEKGAQDVLQDAAVAVVLRLAWRVDAHRRREGLVAGLDLDLAGDAVSTEAGDLERLLTGQPERLAALAVGELQRQHAHPDQVRPVNPLVGLGDDRAHTQQRGALCRPVTRRAG